MRTPRERPDGIRLGIVATRAYPDIGGIESHVENLVQRLDADEWDADIVVTDVTGRLPARDVRHAVPVRRHRAYPAGRDWYASPALLADVARGRRDLIHVHGVNALVPPFAMIGALLAHTPYVVTFHSGGAHTDLRRRLRSTQWRVLGPLLRRAAALIAVSESERRVFATVVRGKEIRVIPNGSLELPMPADVAVDPNLVLSVGRLEHYKGHHRAVEALPRLMELRPGARLEIVGSGPYEPELRAHVDRLGLTDRVTIGAVPPEDRAGMARRLAAAAAVAALSDYEAHPVAVLEAASLGRPVIARRNSGFVELIDAGVVDGIADTAGPAEVATALDRAMHTPQRDPLALPTWGASVDRISAVYREVLRLAR